MRVHCRGLNGNAGGKGCGVPCHPAKPSVVYAKTCGAEVGDDAAGRAGGRGGGGGGAARETDCRQPDSWR